MPFQENRCAAGGLSPAGVRMGAAEWDAGQGSMRGELAELPKTQVSANLGCIGKVNEMQVVHLGNFSNALLAGE